MDAVQRFNSVWEQVKRAPDAVSLRSRSNEILTALQWGCDSRPDVLTQNIDITMKAIGCLSRNDLLSERGRTLLATVRGLGLTDPRVSRCWLCCWGVKDPGAQVVFDAIASGDQDVVVALLDNGFSVKGSMLQLACQMEDMERVVLKLLERGVDPCIVNASALLRWAYDNEQLAIVHILVRDLRINDQEVLNHVMRGALIRHVDEQLFYEVLEGRDYLREQALYECCVKSDANLASYVIGLGARPYNELFVMAMDSGNMALMNVLLDGGLNVNGTTINGTPFLLNACRLGREEIVTMLLGRGANSRARDANGRSALDILMNRGDLALLRLLVKKDPSLLRDVDMTGKTLLHHACENSPVEVILELFQLGADISVVDKDGRVPLFYAVWPQPRLEVLQILLDDFSDLVQCLIAIPGLPDRNRNKNVQASVAREIVSLIEDWSVGADPYKFKDRSVLEVPILFGVQGVIKKMIGSMSSEACRSAYERLGKRFGLSSAPVFLDHFFVVDKKHYNAGAVIQEVLPPVLPMVYLTYLETEVDRGVVSGQVAGPLRELIRELIRKVRAMEPLYGMGGYSRGRVRDWYRDICYRYLFHVIDAHKMGQAGCDSQSIPGVLSVLAEMQPNCMWRWEYDIKQLYQTRPGADAAEAPPNITVADRLLQRLRDRRIGILKQKLLTERARVPGGIAMEVHEPNYLLDTFRQELGTRMPQINDPHAGVFRTVNHPDVARRKFEAYERPSLIVQELFEHLRKQQHAKRPEQGVTSFSAAEIYDWLRSQVAVYWKEQEYASLKNIVGQKLSQKESPQAVQAFLANYGIDWNLGESVADAMARLSAELRGLHMTIHAQKGIMAHLNDLAEDATKTADDLRDWMQDRGIVALKSNKKHELVTQARNSLLKQSQEYDADRQRLLKIEANLKNVKTVEAQRAILAGAKYMRGPRPLNEVLSPAAVRQAQISTFFATQVYDGEGNFTSNAALLLLLSVKDSSGNPIIFKQPRGATKSSTSMMSWISNSMRGLFGGGQEE